MNNESAVTQTVADPHGVNISASSRSEDVSLYAQSLLRKLGQHDEEMTLSRRAQNWQELSRRQVVQQTRQTLKAACVEPMTADDTKLQPSPDFDYEKVELNQAAVAMVAFAGAKFDQRADSLSQLREYERKILKNFAHAVLQGNIERLQEMISRYHDEPQAVVPVMDALKDELKDAGIGIYYECHAFTPYGVSGICQIGEFRIWDGNRGSIPIIMMTTPNSEPQLLGRWPKPSNVIDLKRSLLALSIEAAKRLIH
jgi:hypothetical protein